MKIKKRELIISIIMIIAFIVMSFNISVQATSVNADPNRVTLTIPTNNTNTPNMIEVVDGTNSAQPTNTNASNNTNTNTAPTQLADTGLEDLPWLVIGLCVISAVFAYNKIREYKSI